MNAFLGGIGRFLLYVRFLYVYRVVSVYPSPQEPPASPRRVVHFFVTQYTGFFKELGKPRIFDGKFV